VIHYNDLHCINISDNQTKTILLIIKIVIAIFEGYGTLYTFCDKEEFEDTKEAINIRKSKKDRQHYGQRKKTQGLTTISKTLHRKLNIEQHEPSQTRG
jgi:hypothetical protein